MANMINSAELALNKAVYKGEGRNFNFEPYVRVHVERHEIIKSMTIHGYSGIDNHSKVRRLMQVIHVSELQHIQVQFGTNPDISCNFTRVVSMYKDSIIFALDTAKARKAQISAMKTDNGSDDDGPLVVKDVRKGVRWYNPKDYNKLSSEEKNDL